MNLCELPVQASQLPVQKSQPVRDACSHHSAARHMVWHVGHQVAESCVLHSSQTVFLHDKVVVCVGDYKDQLDEQTMTMNKNASSKN